MNISDVRILKFKRFLDTNGLLVPIEFKDLPFNPKRSFYVMGADGSKRRGQHAHKITEQVLICLSGKITCVCHDGQMERVDLLESCDTGLYIPNEIWDEQLFFSRDTILLVYSNTEYDKNDYITKWEEFLDWKRQNIKS